LKTGFTYILSGLLLIATAVQAQTADSTKATDTAKVAVMQQTDTVAATIRKKMFEPNPKKAGMYSALLPGAGQFYNRQYWKIPVIYAGVVTAGYFIKYNADKYNNYHVAYVQRVANPYITDKYTGIYSTDNLKTLQDDYKKYVDLTVLAAGVGYILQVMDAVVYAYLKNFDVSRDISFHMRAIPTTEGATIGIAMNFK
jgi:hypothetical protein